MKKKKEKLKMDMAMARQGLWVSQQEHWAFDEVYK